jgi:hypothetical protein
MLESSNKFEEETKMTFFEDMERDTSRTLTDNGAETFNTTLNANLDFFAMAGSSRRTEEDEVATMFRKAFYEDRETAFLNLIHLRNIRMGGLGERRAFRICLNELLELKGGKEYVKKFIEFVPELGRWDDLTHLFASTQDKGVRRAIATLIASTLHEDVKNYKDNKPITLMAKWLPSVNTSSAKTKRTAMKLVAYLYGTASPEKCRKYRKTLAALRKYLDVVERKMSAGRWEDIDFETVPSKAAITYRSAFLRHDESRYRRYLDALEKGDAKVNASVTYPYEIVGAYNAGSFGFRAKSYDTLLEGAWKALPDYIEGSGEKAIVVADVSGSMSVDNNRPMNTSVSLAIYCAERLTGAFGGKYITFSDTPKILSIHKGGSLRDNVNTVGNSEWGGSTNIEAVFDLILRTTQRSSSPQDLPSKVIVVSDMEFNQATRRGTNLELAKQKYREAGLEMPQLVFWNVAGDARVTPAQKDEKGVALVSGLSPTIFKSVLSGDILNPVKMMMDTLDKPEYRVITNKVLG